ncbi:MAG: nucleoside monophosphate kinase [Lentisphaerales bacterium]|nr:nucleoside monophosphate kinase [Lentisphaerales bacterium]
MSSEKPRAVLLFGPPGAGKGTIGSMICAAGNHYHLSSGDIFRGLPPESKSGQLFYSYANEGKLVPDDVTIEICWRYLNGLVDTNKFHPAQQLLLLDGLPRTANQAKLIEEYVDVLHVIVLTIEDEEELYRRIGRRGKIEGRNDDGDRAIVAKRLKEYHEKTAKVLEYYPDAKISKFSAEQAPMEVLRDVLVGCTDILKKR